VARLDRRRRENVDGDLYVDSSCIDCDTCRWMAPLVFARRNGKSAVVRQPSSDRAAALEALVACPTASIGWLGSPEDVVAASRNFPLPITEDVFHCGYHAESSFGAASYLIRRPQGNILVDSPRYAEPLARRLESMGGVSLMVFTHRDDVADHALWARRFACPRVIHADDSGRTGMERQIEGLEPVEVAPDLLMIPTPGHTRGHSVLLYASKVLFTGDHLAYDEDEGALRAFEDATWYSWSRQIESMARLLDFSFEWVLPGHGRRFHAPATEMRRQVEGVIDWMKSRAR
jgi:glyoxylase-like metal-dependent hydrolase (beta-lactamase superfamily II)/ferredoxin